MSTIQVTQKYPGLRLLSYADVPKAAYTLSEAFREDSLAKLLVCHFPTKEEQVRCETMLYEAYLRQHIAKGIVLGINESDHDFETVAIWSHPTSEQEGLDSFSTLMEAGYGQVWEAYGEQGREKVFRGMLPLLHNSCHRILSAPQFKDKGVFTLVYLGSLEKARGKGNVRKMFDFMFENYIDNQPNTISYLESSSPTNIPIYNRFGFHFAEDIMLGSKHDGAVEGKDYAIMSVMIRGTRGKDWRNESKPSMSQKL